MPTAEVQVATLDGMVGSGMPLATLAVQVPVPPGGLLHHWEEVQSASLSQPVAQSPVVVLQTWPFGHIASVVHMPHWPVMVPLRKQKGWPGVGHGSVAEEPWLPLQGTQVEDVASQTGVSLAHVVELTHWTQVLVVVLQTGVAPEHCESIEHPTQVPAFGPEVAQMVERHTLSPLPALQGPSPLA